MEQGRVTDIDALLVAKACFWKSSPDIEYGGFYSHVGNSIDGWFRRENLGVPLWLWKQPYDWMLDVSFPNLTCALALH